MAKAVQTHRFRRPNDASQRLIYTLCSIHTYDACKHGSAKCLKCGKVEIWPTSYNFAIFSYLYYFFYVYLHKIPQRHLQRHRPVYTDIPSVAKGIVNTALATE